ncbi:MAG: adenylate/guanylate cyclase domain-containing protein [Alphaproteobacteria bacterium]|nr:adenylate/guanylate cyclase domain-containing protein [Alphaproteobacteria bacterium]MCZ6844578.1 adenylate/guanylate cyclase domain-containing protein [Alphaproteobacteria bacterium]
MATASDLLGEREFHGIRIALIARLIVLAIGIVIDQTIGAQPAHQINALVGLSAGFVVVALLLLILQLTQWRVLVGLVAVVVDAAIMAGLLVAWWNDIGGAAVTPALLFKSSMPGVMAILIALNALTLRPLYPALATVAMVLVYGGLAAIALDHPQTQWTDDYFTAFVGQAVSLPQVLSGFAILLIFGGLIVATTWGARRLTLGGIRLEKANAQLGRYFSPTVRDQISVAGDDFMKPGGRVQDIAVLFCDIRDFTRLSEGLRPEELMAFLSDYQQRMVDAVFANGGTLDKFIGDAVMATFGTPTARPEATRQAVDAAIAMRAALADLNRERAAAGKPEIQHGIGIHCGPAVVGNVGTVDRLEYTVMGDTVNVAALIADHCKETKEDLLISAAVRAQLAGPFPVREMPAIEAKGRREPVQLFAVDAGAGDISADNTSPDFGREDYTKSR